MRLNTSPLAAPWRAGMIALLMIGWLIWLWRRGLRVPLPAAVLIGVLAAYTISEAYWRPGGYGIQGWLIVAAIYTGQVVARRNWAPDLAVAGIGFSVLVLLAASTGEAPPEGLWNRNMVAGLLAALLPAAWARWKPGGALVAIAIAITGSRGALVAASVAAVVLAWPYLARVLVGTPARAAAGLGSISAAVVGMYGLIGLRVPTVEARIACMAETLALWWSRAPVWGLGQFELYLSTGDVATNGHSVPITLVIALGLAGAVVIVLAVLGLATGRLRYGWQLASLLAICTHALIEENVAWWPVGIVLGIVAADSWEWDGWQKT